MRVAAFLKRFHLNRVGAAGGPDDFGLNEIRESVRMLAEE